MSIGGRVRVSFFSVHLGFGLGLVPKLIHTYLGGEGEGGRVHIMYPGGDKLVGLGGGVGWRGRQCTYNVPRGTRNG